MNLSRATLAKIYLSYHPIWFKEGNARLSESGDGGTIYLEDPPYSSGSLLIISAMIKEKGDVPFEKIEDIVPKRNFGGYLVLPYDSITPSILSRLSKLESRWQESQHGFRICVVADVGRDSSTGEMKYSYRGFDAVEELTNLIKGELVAQGSQTDVDPYSIPGFKIKAAIRNYLVKSSRKGVTLRQVNKTIQDLKSLIQDKIREAETNT